MIFVLLTAIIGMKFTDFTWTVCVGTEMLRCRKVLITDKDKVDVLMKGSLNKYTAEFKESV